MTTTALEEVLESGVGALALAFGVIAGSAVYLDGSLGAVPAATAAFISALSLTVWPSLSLAAWPNLLAALAGVVVAARLAEPISVRAAAFVATYSFVAVLVHYAVAA